MAWDQKSGKSAVAESRRYLLSLLRLLPHANSISNAQPTALGCGLCLMPWLQCPVKSVAHGKEELGSYQPKQARYLELSCSPGAKEGQKSSPDYPLLE